MILLVFPIEVGVEVNKRTTSGWKNHDVNVCALIKLNAIIQSLIRRMQVQQICEVSLLNHNTYCFSCLLL